MQFERVCIVILKSIFSLVLMFGAFLALIVFGAVMRWHCTPWDYIQPAFFWIALLSLASLLLRWITTPAKCSGAKLETGPNEAADGFRE